MDSEEKYLSTTETAERLSITRQRVLQLIESEALPAKKVGNSYIILETDLALVADRKPGRPPKTEADEPTEETPAEKPKKGKKAK